MLASQHTYPSTRIAPAGDIMIVQNPGGVNYFSLGFQPEVKKKSITRFGVIFDGEAENYDKT